MGGDFGWSILPVSRSLRTYNNNYIRESSEERYPISGNEYSVNNCPELRNLFKTIAERLNEIFPSLCPVYIEFHTAKICVWLVLLCLRSRFREIAIASKRRQLAFTCEPIPYLYTQSWTQCDCDLVIKIAAMNFNARCHHNIVDSSWLCSLPPRFADCTETVTVWSIHISQVHLFAFCSLPLWCRLKINSATFINLFYYIVYPTLSQLTKWDAYMDIYARAEAAWPEVHSNSKWSE